MKVREMGNAKVKYRYPIVVEWGADNCSAFLPDIDGCVTTGATVEETVANMHEALQMHLETMLEDGDVIPPASSIDHRKFPLNVALVMDDSGSMKGAKLTKIKSTVKMVIDRLEPTDYISVVLFNDTFQVIIPSMPANDKSGMKAAIDRIKGTLIGDKNTTMSLGMAQGLVELRRWNIPNAVKRMILLTDGITYGDTNRCRQLAMDAATMGIIIPTMAVGTDQDKDLLDDIEALNGGAHAKTEFLRLFGM